MASPLRLLLLCSSLLCGCGAAELEEAQKPAGPTGEVVYSVADIEKGATIPSEKLEVKTVPLAEVPPDAVKSDGGALTNLAFHKATRHINAGETLMRADVEGYTDPPAQESESGVREVELPKNTTQTETIYYLVKDVPEGEIITSEAVEERKIDKAHIPEYALASLDRIVGHKARRNIPSGEILGKGDVVP